MSDGTNVASTAPAVSAPAESSPGKQTTPGTPPPAPKGLKIRDAEYRSEDDAYADIQRGRQSQKLLTQAEQRFKEAAAREKALEESRSRIKNKDRKALLQTLGLSKEEARDILSDYLYQEEVLPSQLDPRELRIRELEQREKDRVDAEEKTAKEKKAEEHRKAVDGEKSKLAKEIGDLLEGKKLPKSRYLVRRTAEYMAAYQQSGADVPAAQAAERVMHDYGQEMGGIISESSVEQLETLLGKENWKALAKKVSKWALAQRAASAPRSQSGQFTPAVQPQGAMRVGPPDARHSKRITMAELEARLKAKLK